MCRIKIHTVFFLIVLNVFLVATLNDEETCELDREMEKKCRLHNYKTVKPLLDYFRQVRNELEDKEIKENKLNELNSDLMEKYNEIVRIHEKFMKEATLLDEYKNKVLKGENDLQLSQNKVEKLESKIKSQKQIIDKLTPISKLYDKCKEEVADKSISLKSSEFQLKQFNSSLFDKDENIRRLNANIEMITEQQKTLELKLENSKTKLIQQDKDLQLCQSEIDTLNRTSENIREQQKKIELQFKDCQTNIIDKVKENQLYKSELDKSGATSCIPFGDSDVHQLNVCEIGFFDVLCDSQLAGPGWIVIQQRVGGNEDFNRDWETYRKGFGSYKSDFFLGLEKIHRITSLQRFELYIHLVAVNGSTYNARYDDFKISDEDSGYKLSLGKFNGTIIEDAMRDGERMKFLTFDRNNDKADIGNCAKWFKSGWWYQNCYNCNLNAPYGGYLHWWVENKIELKEAKMLIRPKRSDVEVSN
ncbi:fibrinogen-like protein 1 isoform X1 [Drosophila sulfurigaster albostrigata]|uniref:fibrinogen-like protein 1 isoform X1 n=1 Tax=Drosophila sulfurigaster albostrigata TaxID=89887 RepID=UPI002D21D39B|nr:fibrinogen-like protein 1 isoform X1 [Drosophila sulfurigaster albostrigata]